MQNNPKEGLNPSAQQPQPPTHEHRAASNSFSAFKALAIIAAGLFTLSCKDKPEEITPSSQTHTAANTTLTLTVSATSLPTSGILSATLRAEHPQSTHIEFPETTTPFGDFTIFDFQDTPPALNSSGKITTARTYILEPDLPGTSTLPALTTTVLAADGTPTEILTDPVPIQVTSVLTEGETKPSDIVTSLSEKKSGSSPFIPVGIVVFASLGLVYLISKRQTDPVPPATTTNHEKFLTTLTDLPPSSILSAMEPPLAHIISHRHHLTATDFTALEKSTIPGLAPLIARHRKLSYSANPPSPEEVTSLLTDFKTFIAKEAT